ncbi:MAG: HAD hydrolase-like protein [Planctomycetes bacterium]|nr:HAD hydrolase-like protein [Planctomycetota bacterium]
MRAVLLDFDGTLVDSGPSICAGLSAALRSLSLPVPPEAELRACIGLPLKHVWSRLGVPAEQHQAAGDGYRAWSRSADAVPAKPFAGIPELLRLLRRRGVLLVLASAKDTDSARRAVAAQGWEQLFHAVHGAEPGDGPDKRDLVRRALGSLPAGCSVAAMVGDMPVDADAAAANAIPFIGCLWGYGRRSDLAALPHLAMASDVRGLTRVLSEQRAPRRGVLLRFLVWHLIGFAVAVGGFEAWHQWRHGTHAPLVAWFIPDQPAGRR